jgi:polysaccharide export outer membrane protein
VTKHLIPRLALVLLLFLGAGADALAGQDAPVPGVTRAGDEAIRPGDVVKLTVLREKELTGEFPVNQFNTVVLPLVGEYDVSKETNRSLREKVIHDLMEIRAARDIELVVLRRVRVVGEVNKPGVYNVDPTMSIADAIALAMGRTQMSQEGKVIVRRGQEVQEGDVRIDLPLSELSIRSGDEIFVPRRSWLNLNLSPVVTAASIVAGILVTILSK